MGEWRLRHTDVPDLLARLDAGEPIAGLAAQYDITTESLHRAIGAGRHHPTRLGPARRAGGGVRGHADPCCPGRLRGGTVNLVERFLPSDVVNPFTVV